MSELSLERMLALPKHPDYAQGRALVQYPSKKYQIGHLRSWQHKASRRSDFKPLVRACALQLCAGFVRTFTKYFACVIVPEDIGLANLGLVQGAAQLFESVQSAPWNPRKNIVSLVQVLYSLCEAVSSSCKSRAVPCLATLALFDCLHRKVFEMNPAEILSSFGRLLQECRAQDGLSLEDPLLRECCVLAQMFLLHCSFERTKSNQKKLWAFFPVNSSPLLQTLRRMEQKHESWDNRLLFFFALLVVAFRLEKAQPKPLPRLELASEEAALQFMRTCFEGDSLPDVPAYARDKHTGGKGGYQQFFEEGIRVPTEKRLLPRVHDRLLAEEKTLRLEHEETHGRNSSKSSTLAALILKKFFAQRSPQKRRAPSALPKPKRARRNEPVLPYPVAQNVTSLHKLYVYLKDDVVLKGPYQRPKLSLNLENARKVRGLDAVRKLDPSVLQPSIVQLPEGTFLSWPNIGERSKVVVARQSTKLAENVKVVKRKTYVFRASDVEIDEMHPDLLLECLNHLYARFVFNIGDSAFYNILIAEMSRNEEGLVCGRAVGVDLEEHRGKIDFSSPQSMLFSGRPRTAQLLAPYYSQIVQVPPGWPGSEQELARVAAFRKIVF